MDSIPAIEALRTLVRRFSGHDPRFIERMTGGASTRLFFRIGLNPGGSAVAIYVPNAGTSDEIVNQDESSRGRWPYLEVRDLLEQHGVRVPELHGEDCDAGLIVVEDLGDLTLANYLVCHQDERTDLYKRAVRDLARAQQKLARLPDECIVRQRRFDRDLLRWEVDHFREWALEARGIHLDSEDRRTFDTAADYLSEVISEWPYGFVHRDYQSRNLMVRGEGVDHELVWIDFQDALLGPRVYDLVALLSDSYQTFTRDFVDERLDDYAAFLGLNSTERAQVGYEFDIVTVQRKLKDAGRFVFIERVNKNPDFLEFVEPTIDKALAALRRLSDRQELRALHLLLERVLSRK